MQAVTVLDATNRREWEQLISSCKQSTFFHTFDSATLFRCMGQTPVHWGLWLDGELAVVWPTHLLSAFGGKVLRVSAPATIEGVDATQLHRLVSHIVDATKKEGAFHWSADIRVDSPFLELAPRCGFESWPSRMCTYVVNTTVGHDLLWKQLASVARTGVRQARKHGLDVKQAQDPEDIRTFISIYHSTMERLHAPDYSNDESLVSLLSVLIPEGKAKLFTAHDRESMVAGLVLLLHKQTAYWWIGGSTAESWKMRPNELLLWSIMEWASNSGLREFDLGGAPVRRGHGLHLFKRHLGGQRVDMTHLHLPLNAMKDFLVDSLVSSGIRLYESGLVPRRISSLVLKKNPSLYWLIL